MCETCTSEVHTHILQRLTLGLMDCHGEAYLNGELLPREQREMIGFRREFDPRDYAGLSMKVTSKESAFKNIGMNPS